MQNWLIKWIYKWLIWLKDKKLIIHIENKAKNAEIFKDINIIYVSYTGDVILQKTYNML